MSQEVLKDLLPGPVTLVFERTDQLNPGLNPSTRLVGIRIPDHNFVQQLSLRCEEPLALTSANVSTVGQSSLKIEVSNVCTGGLVTVYFLKRQHDQNGVFGYYIK